MKIFTPLTMMLGLSFSAQVIASQYADSMLMNANIYGHEDADAIAILDGKILAIGSFQSLAHYQNQQTRLADLDQAFVMPGFIDNHNHVFEAASEAGGSCELSMDGGLREQISYLKRCRSDASSDNNEWLMGYGFSIESILNTNVNKTPLQVIDQIFPEKPVVLMELTSHSMWVNSAALNLAGITKYSPEPQGGKILKDEETGELTGILLDNAGDILMEMAWNSLNNQFDQSYDGLMVGLEEAAAHGITTIGDGRLYWKRGWFEVWQAVEKAGDLTARVSLRPWIYPTDPMQEQLAFLKKVQSSDTSRLLMLDQVKMYSDGITLNGTAKLLEPYHDTYIPDEPYGINYIPPKQMSVWLNALDKIGYSAHIHAIGDGAVNESLNAIENMRQQGSTKPYTLTHVELVNKNDVPRFEALDVTADFQVGSDYVAYHDHQWATSFIGRTRTNALMNPRAIYNTGANLTLSSDWNVHDINPLVGIANSLIMGKTGLPNIQAAIEAYTINAAKSLGLENITGSIEEGKSADLVVLKADITQMRPKQIAKTPILMTFLQGDLVFDIKQN